MLSHKAVRCHNPDEKELKRVLLGALFLDPGSGVVSKGCVVGNSQMKQ